jgi:hypothetical protein
MATPTTVIDTGAVIGRDYSGNNVTLQQVLDGGSTLTLLLSSLTRQLPLMLTDQKSLLVRQCCTLKKTTLVLM